MFVGEINKTRRIRKVVISTNIAETSLTISDVVYVVDSGKLRERQFDASKGISALVEGWISQVLTLICILVTICVYL